MPTIAVGTDSTAAFEQLAHDLAAGEDVPADRVHAVVLASGKTFAELEAAADRHAADLLGVPMNRFELIQRRDPLPGDFRDVAGPPRAGDRVTLCYKTDHKPGERPCEYMHVEVIDQVGEDTTFRGRCLHGAFAGLLPPEKDFAEGDVIVFEMVNVIEIGVRP